MHIKKKKPRVANGAPLLQRFLSPAGVVPPVIRIPTVACRVIWRRRIIARGGRIRVTVWVVARIIIWVRCCTHRAAERERAQPNANRRAGADATARIGGTYAGKCDDHCDGGGASQAGNILANHTVPPNQQDPGSECRTLQQYGGLA